jgi:hypothetical protein
MRVNFPDIWTPGKNNDLYICLILNEFKGLDFIFHPKDTFLYNAADSSSWNQWDTSSKSSLSIFNSFPAYFPYLMLFNVYLYTNKFLKLYFILSKNNRSFNKCQLWWKCVLYAHSAYYCWMQDRYWKFSFWRKTLQTHIWQVKWIHLLFWV